mgnify:CR=1 FL=1
MSNLGKSDMRYFQKARQAAEISDYKRTHIGCVAVYQGNIIGIACNTNKTHPMQKRNIIINIGITHKLLTFIQNFMQRLTASLLSDIWILISQRLNYMYIGLVVIRNTGLLAHVLVVWLQLRI